MEEVKEQNYKKKLINELSKSFRVPGVPGRSFDEELSWKYSKTYRAYTITYAILFAILIILFFNNLLPVDAGIVLTGFVLLTIIFQFILSGIIVPKELNKISIDVLKGAVTKKQSVVENSNKPLKVSSPVFKYIAIFVVGLFVLSLVAILVGII